MAEHTISSGSSTQLGMSNAEDDASIYDHYRALPLSDGNLVLFVDPRDGVLTLGREGTRGLGPPSKLERLVKFMEPRWSLAEGHRCNMPTHYNATWDMEWGLRVVASFRGRLFLAGQDGEDVVVYTVPPDVVSSFRRPKEGIVREAWWGYWPMEVGACAESEVSAEGEGETRSSSGSTWAQQWRDCTCPDFVLRDEEVKVARVSGRVMGLSVWNVEDEERGPPEIVVCGVMREAKGLVGRVWTYEKRHMRGIVTVEADGGVRVGGSVGES